jgi:tRNA A37 N6-isopentenylltransferase MiaA
MKKLLVIVGPTGTGKTSLGLSLAQKFGGELVREVQVSTFKQWWRV